MKALLSCRLALITLGAQVGGAGPALGQPGPADGCFARDAAVLDWNAIAVETIGATPPVPAARLIAMTQLAVFEAVNAITGDYEPYFGVISAPSGASPEAAAATAAHDVLAASFPAAIATLDAELATSLVAIGEGQAELDGIAVGEEAAALVLAERTGDGSEPPRFYLPSDLDAGDWQPTPSCTAAGGAFRHWQDVQPFGIISSSQFRAPPPLSLTSEEYARDFDEVKRVGGVGSALRPQDRSDVARLYAAQSAHVGWNSVARQLASVRHDSITETAQTFALLNASLSDALFTVFESKYHYAYWRPETAIARAADDGNERTSPDPTFTPFVTTPCFPSYPSGHGSVAGAASTVLARAYGESDHDLTNATPSLPGVLLHYSRLDQIVSDVSDARVYGGIHFRNDQDAAEELGHQVATYDIEHLFAKRHEHETNEF